MTDHSPALAAENRSSRLTELLMRALTSGVFVFLIAVVTFFAPGWLFSLGAGAFIIAGLYEFFKMLRHKGTIEYGLFGMIIGGVIPFVVYFQLGSNRSGEVLFIVLACFGLFLLQFTRKDNPHALEGISNTFFGIMYISWFLSFIIKIRDLERGSWLVAYLLITTKGGDIGAYLTGTLFGRHTLIKHISPRKSIEGTLGGVLSSGLLSLLFYGVLPLELSVLQLFVTGLMMGVVAQCGDLSESLIKRYCGVKDSGSWIPGFGGVLDLLDSVLFTTPLFYFYAHTLI